MIQGNKQMQKVANEFKLMKKLTDLIKESKRLVLKDDDDDEEM